MPDYQQISIPYVANPHGGSDVFARATSTFSADSLGKRTAAPDKDRQAHFEEQLRRLSEYLGSSDLPVFVNWNGRRRMDKGCIGHSVARGFLCLPEDGPQGYVEQVTLSDQQV